MEDDTAHFETVKKCYLDFRYPFESTGLTGNENIPFVFDQLEEMYIEDILETFLQFIVKQKKS